MKIDRVLLVNKKSLYQLYVKEHRTAAVRRAIRRGDPVAARLQASHKVLQAGLRQARRTLRRFGFTVVERWRADVRTTAEFDLIISFGGDGTLLDASHCILCDTPLLGINADPETSVGALCAGEVDDLEPLIEKLGNGQLRPRQLARIRVRTEGQTLLGPCLNDVLFAHASPAVLTKYGMAVVPASRATRASLLARKRPLPMQRSSGLWVATASGSTAAIRSAGGRPMARGSRQLQYLVREPYVPPGTTRHRGVLGGMVGPDQALVIVSRVRRGMLWGDGPYRRARVTYGEPVILDRYPTPLRLVLAG